MRTISNTFLSLITAIILTVGGCKKQDIVNDKQDQTPEAIDCISLITPTGNAEALQNLEFKWSSCVAGPYTFNLYLGADLVWDTILSDTSFLYTGKMLMSDTIYKWNVTATDSVSEMVHFRTQRTDSIFVGMYRVNHSSYTYSGNNSSNHDYGETIIKVVSLGPNDIEIQDSLGTPLFSVSYSAQSYDYVTANLPNYIYYGMPYDYGSNAAYNLVTGAASFKKTIFQGAGGGSYERWSGYKIP